MKNKKLIILLCMCIGISAYGEEKSTQDTTSAAAQENTTESSGITNAKMKALDGSKSKLSVKVNLDYYGATVKNPLSELRPNPTGNPVIPETFISGSMAMKYRLDKKTTLGAGLGVRLLTPAKSGASRTEVKSPYVTYSKSYNLFGTQNISGVKLAYVSAARYRDIGQDWYTTYSHYLAKKIGKTRWTLGTSFGVVYKQFYLSKQERFAMDPGLKRDYDYGWGAAPFVEYALTDDYTLVGSVTVGGTHYFENTSLESDPILADLGVGIAVSDEIYVTPAIQYYPEKPNLETTTVNINAIISL